MSIKDLQLKGNNFCDIECVDRNSIIHPETCVDQVLTGHNTQTLSEWLDEDSDPEVHHGSFDTYSNLKAWLINNYPIDIPSLPTASTSTKGGIKVGNYLTIDNEILSVDKTSLEIPTISTATYNNTGVIKLGNSTPITNTIEDSPISNQLSTPYEYNGYVYTFPLRLDSNGNAGITVPTNLFSSSNDKKIPKWTLDWSKRVTSVNTTPTPPNGVVTNYILLGNKSINTLNGGLGYDLNGNLSTNYGYPKLALVAGENVSFTRYNKSFISSADNFWGDDITEILIEAGQTQSDWNQTTVTATNYIKNKPSLLSISSHSSDINYFIKGPGDNTNKYLKGDGSWNTISYTELTDKPVLTSVMTYKGSVSDTTDLDNIVDPNTGDVYNVQYDDHNYAYNGASWDDLGGSFDLKALSNSNHNIDELYTINGSGYTGTATKFLKEDGTWEVPTNTTYSAGANITITDTESGKVISATNTTYTTASSGIAGLIKLGYTTNGNNKPVQVDNEGRAFVDTEFSPTTGGMITSGLHANFFRPKNISLQTNCYIPILASQQAATTPQGKMSIVFEIFGREDSETYYGKYYVNCMHGLVDYQDIICLGFYTQSSRFTSPTDIVMLVSPDKQSIVIYKRETAASDGMYVVNILAENEPNYSLQTYYTTIQNVSGATTLTQSDGISYSDWENVSGTKELPSSMCTWTT